MDGPMRISLMAGAPAGRNSPSADFKKRSPPMSIQSTSTRSIGRSRLSIQFINCPPSRPSLHRVLRRGSTATTDTYLCFISVSRPTKSSLAARSLPPFLVFSSLLPLVKSWNFHNWSGMDVELFSAVKASPLRSHDNQPRPFVVGI